MNGELTTTASVMVATTSTTAETVAEASTITTTASISPADSRLAEIVSRRRGIGKTLPVGWKPLSPPNEAVRWQILQQIISRRKKKEEARDERVVRVEKFKREEKLAWHMKRIEDCEKDIRNLNARKVVLDDTKKKLYGELKKVLSTTNHKLYDHAAVRTYLVLPQARNKAFLS